MAHTATHAGIDLGLTSPGGREPGAPGPTNVTPSPTDTPQAGDIRIIQEGGFTIVQEFDPFEGWLAISATRDPAGGTSGFGGRPLAEELQLLAEAARLRGDADTAQRLFDAAQAILDREAREEEAERGREFEEEQAALDRQFREQQDELARANQERLQRLSEANRLVLQKNQLQADARTLLAQTLGVDPVRSAVLAQGFVPQGRSPAQAFRSEASAFARQPVPTPGMDASLGNIESVIQALQNPAGPQAQGPFVGFARGGLIDMGKGRNGTFEMRNVVGLKEGEGVIVGDGLDGEGIRAGTAELVVRRPRGIEVIPIRAAMQTGGDIDFDRPFEDIFNTLPQALSPIFGSLGFQSVPSLDPTFFEGSGFDPLLAQQLGGLADFGLSENNQGILQRILDASAGIGPPIFGRGDLFGRNFEGQAALLQQLGVQPRLIRIAERHPGDSRAGLFFIQPDGTVQKLQDASFGAGSLRIGNPGVFGGPDAFNLADVVNLTSADAAQLGLGSGPQGLAGAPPFTGQDISQIRSFAPRALPIVLPNETGSGGTLLPQPRMIAQIFNRLDPATQQVIRSAYDVAGFTGFDRELSFFTPSGSGGRGLTLGLG